MEKFWDHLPASFTETKSVNINSKQFLTIKKKIHFGVSSVVVSFLEKKSIKLIFVWILFPSMTLGEGSYFWILFPWFVQGVRLLKKDFCNKEFKMRIISMTKCDINTCNQNKINEMLRVKWRNILCVVNKN